MSRSGYSYDIDNWELIKWRGRVTSAIRGKRGQEFFAALLEALDAMPGKRLIQEELEANGEVCALGALGKKRGLQLDDVDPEDHDTLSRMFNIASCLVAEVEYMNDDWRERATPEERWKLMREWAVKQIKVSR